MAVERISTVLVPATATAPAGPYDLTDLTTVHDELSVETTDPENDPFLSRAITQASAAIARFCNRVFAIETVQDLCYIQQDPYPWQVPGGVYPLQLSRWPLVQTGVVLFTGNTHGNTSIDGILPNTTGLVAGQLLFDTAGALPPGCQIQAIDGANAITLTLPATSSAAADSFNTGLQVVQTLSTGVTNTLVYGANAEAGGDFTIDAPHGWLIRLSEWTGVSETWEAEPTTVQYQAGYASTPTGMPSDLQEACLRLVVMRFRARGRDPRLVEETQPGAVGSMRYWVGPTPGQSGQFPPEIESLLQPYRVPVVT